MTSPSSKHVLQVELPWRERMEEVKQLKYQELNKEEEEPEDKARCGLCCPLAV